MVLVRGNMRDLILLSIYFYSLNMIFTEKSYMALWLTLFITLVFILRYIRLNITVSNLKKHSKKVVKRILKMERDSFAEALIHDIKIPTLAQLRGVDLLKKEILGDLNDDQQELLFQIGASCKYILEMISMLTNVYRFDAGTYQPKYEKFNLLDLVIICFDELSNQAREKNITFSHLCVTDTSIEADKAAIKRVILNMLLNTINFSKEGDEIVIKIETEGDKIVFSAIGKNFAGINGSTKYSTVGHKIGLYLCKKIVEYHQGQIYSPSDANTVMFKIPRINNILPVSTI